MASPAILHREAPSRCALLKWGPFLCEGEPLSKKAIAKHILLLHKQYREMHRASVSAELLENQVRCRVACNAAPTLSMFQGRMTDAQDKVQRMLAKKEESVKWPDVSVPKSASILTSGEVHLGHRVSGRTRQNRLPCLLMGKCLSCGAEG